MISGWSTNFNPRTPYGVRRVLDAVLRLHDDFNPRTPYGVRHKSILLAVCTVAFQSTHPVWGATQTAEKYARKLEISIHAPRMGCDV